MARGILLVPASEGWSGEDRIRRIRLKEDKESCRIRFLTEHDDVFFARFHPNDDPPLFGEVCVKEEFGRACDSCDKGKTTRMLWFAWVYEYTHDYIDKDDIPEEANYETLKFGSGRKSYRVEINEVGLMCYAAGHKDSIAHFADKHNTLLDRDYEWSRSGKAGDKETSYLLEPDDKEKMSSELNNIMIDLPDLEKIAAGEVDSFSSDDEEEEAPKRRKKVEKDVGNSFDEMIKEEEESEAPF